MQVILASRSPQRKQLLENLGIEFQVFSPDVDERLAPGSIDAALTALAIRKARSAGTRYSAGLSIGCDTVVVIDGCCLGKPRDLVHARSMLGQLSGRTHEVKSALALVNLASGQTWSGIESTQVRFRPLTESDIEHYLHCGEADDKAGAYAIQGHAVIFIEAVNGCLCNVIGFPAPLFIKLKQAAEAC